MFKFLQNFKFGKKVRALFQRKVDDEAIEELEKLFFEIDLGSELALQLVEKVKTLYRKNAQSSSEEILEEIRKTLLTSFVPSSTLPFHKPHIILVIGINGSGKTTSVAKIAHHYRREGKKVLIGACDTFRAAASDQLEIWAQRADIEIVKGKPMSDPAAIAFDTIVAGKARDADVIILDTAGRLHTRQDLMLELEKVRKVIGKAHTGAPHETLLVLDATLGQNALDQARIFNKSTPITALILTKLDGTAKGGTALAIQKKLQLPIKYVGVGEGLDDLQLFDPTTFVQSLFE